MIDEIPGLVKAEKWPKTSPFEAFARQNRATPVEACKRQMEAVTKILPIWQKILHLCPTITGMRFVLSLASVMTVTLLIFNGYANGSGDNSRESFAAEYLDPVTRANDVSMIVEDNLAIQRKSLEK